MNLTEIWELIQPYIMSFFTFISSGAVGAILGNIIAKSVTRKFDINAMTTQVADKLTGSKINIDLKAVTEKQLSKISKLFIEQIADLQEKINMILTYQGDTISCIKSSAKLKESERDRLLNDLEGIKNATTPITPKDEISIEILKTESRMTADGVKNSLINFD